jgi:hypothetical protein
MNIIESRNKAKEEFRSFCKSRELGDFNKIVQIVHQDGSIFVLHCASIWWSQEQYNAGTPPVDHFVPAWIGVSTEHNGDLMFHGGDLLSWWIRN